MKREISYYDLIEFPSGRHIPVPIAMNIVGLEDILKIPISEKKRGEGFYFCEKCYEICKECDEDYGDVLFCEYDCDIRPHSFYRCTVHRPITLEENKSKEALLEIFIELGLHEHLRYIETATPYRYLKWYITIGDE